MFSFFRLEKLSDSLTPWDVVLSIRGLSRINNERSNILMKRMLNTVTESMSDYKINQLGIVFTAMRKLKSQATPRFLEFFEKSVLSSLTAERTNALYVTEILGFYADCTKHSDISEKVKKFGPDGRVYFYSQKIQDYEKMVLLCFLRIVSG